MQGFSNWGPETTKGPKREYGSMEKFWKKKKKNYKNK